PATSSIKRSAPRSPAPSSRGRSTSPGRTAARPSSTATTAPSTATTLPRTSSRRSARPRRPRGSASARKAAAGSGREAERAAGRRGGRAPVAASPDGQYKALYRDRTLWLTDAKGVLEMRITADGDEKARIKNGTASWVYGEELRQRSAIWWSPDSKKVAFYRF